MIAISSASTRDIAELEGARHHAQESAQETHHQFLAADHQGHREGGQRDRHALELGHPDPQQQQEHHRGNRIARGHGPGAIAAAVVLVPLLAGLEKAVDELHGQHAGQHNADAKRDV
ncbi:hypothetical protein OR16_18216 [Cupriavidus basilensis OR16]|uniref:Uncharacterized protein n=1 Tax=Cupriavidus basilensis OR16 TaxID=1127483 RepID=H1S6U3_9BURK|nr:hypothetical protein [Cupriavidus basilensis]EHP41754.1 hypothetical protein OR16_18216 [Cupriavidus basilensis OR16]